MRDWNLRVILNRIWGAQQLDVKSWAVQREPADAERAQRSSRRSGATRGDVDLLYATLSDVRRAARRGGVRRSVEPHGMTDGSRRPEPDRAPPPETPYVGLVPYSEDDAAFFFGRDAEKRIVTANLRASRLTIVYGASGVGKTSLLQAGVVHDLREQLRAHAATRRERAPFAICVVPRLARRSALRADGGDPRCRRGGARRRELDPWRPGEPRGRDAARVDRACADAARRARPVRGLLPLPRGRGRRATRSRRSSRDRQRAEPARELPRSRSARTRGRSSTASRAGSRSCSRTTSGSSTSTASAREEAIERPIDEWNRRLPPDERARTRSSRRSSTPSSTRPPAGSRCDGGDAVGRARRGDEIEAPFLQLVMERLWRATVDAGAHALTRRDARRARRRAADRREPPARRARPAHARASRRSPPTCFRYLVTRSKTKIAHPASDLAEWTGRPEPEVDGRAREALPRRERPHPAPGAAAAGRTARARATSSSTTCSPSRSSSGDGTSSRSASAPPRRGASVRCAGGSVRSRSACSGSPRSSACSLSSR